MSDTSIPMGDPARALLRHTLATLAYRGGKAIRDCSPVAAEHSAGLGSRTPLQILAHINDVLDWALRLSQGEKGGFGHPPEPWAEEVARFHAGLAAFDAVLASSAPLVAPPERLFQGPIADALTHVGQIAYLRRLAGAPVRGENYFKAEIEAGRVGPEQSLPVFEFD